MAFTFHSWDAAETFRGAPGGNGLIDYSGSDQQRDRGAAVPRRVRLRWNLALTLAPPRCSASCQPPKDDLIRDQERWYHDPTPLQWEFQSVCARHLFSGAPSARGGANMPISHTMLWYFIENRA